jgi:hypothetical protein
MKRWLLLLLIIAAALAFVVPVWLVQPFKPQTTRALAVGYEVKRIAPWATIALALGALVLVARMWRASQRRWAKAVMLLLLLPVGASVWAARQNVYEVMFNPLVGAAYARPGEVDYISDEDMVLAVEREGERAAYPVRLLAYHHLVADKVGDVPIVATY